MQQTPLSPALHQTRALIVLKEGKAEQTRDSFQVLPDSPFKGRTQSGKNTCRYKHTNTNTNTQRQRQTHTKIKTHKDKHTKKQGKAEQTPFKCCQIYPSKGKAEHMEIQTHKDKHMKLQTHKHKKKEEKAEQTPFKCCQTHSSKGTECFRQQLRSDRIKEN